MAAYISFQPKDNFFTKTYTGIGSSLGVTGVGFQPDLTIIKNRDGTNSWGTTDSVRGALYQLFLDGTDASTSVANSLTAFDSDGFTVGSNGGWGGSNDYASWNWKAGTTSGIATNGSTTITPSTYSFNQTTGFSIIEYTGNATAGAKVAHGLGAIPEVVICKIVTPYSGDDWTTYNHILGNTKNIPINAANAAGTSTTRWNDTSPDSVNITLGTDSSVNQSGGTQIAYCFVGIPGFSKFGYYVGNGNDDGPFVYTGFKPSLVICKRTDSTGEWVVKYAKSYDPVRNINEKYLYANASNAEVDSTGFAFFDFLSNGFKWGDGDATINASGGDYIYMAWAESPIVSSNDIPTVGR